MSSSTSSSNHRRFVLWVALGLVTTNAAVQLVPWGGIKDSERGHHRVAYELAGDTDFLIVGDSKAGPFSVGCLVPWLSTYRALVFSGDSVTPVFHYKNLIDIRNAVPEFKPRVVFIFVGANNFNTNGQHVQREYTFFNDLDLGRVWELSAVQGEPLFFVEAVLSRIFPLYGKRVMITHLQFGKSAVACSSTAPESFEIARHRPVESGTRNPVYDKNYYDIYRRSVYASYQSSPIIARATEKLIESVRAFGGTPIVVLPPVTHEIRALEHQLIGDAFDQTLTAILDKEKAQLLDLRDENHYEFQDVNHLSPRGAHDLAVDYFLPIVERQFSTIQAAKGGPGSSSQLIRQQP
jgi:hypothetical protein